MRNHTSEDAYESWNTQLVIAGSDSTDDRSLENQLNADTDISNFLDDDFARPLASSIRNLNLFDPPNPFQVPRMPQKSGVY
jgi:hypothetical protein